MSRSDSQRSDTSRPRVSFNRDVHVKRIGTPGAPRVIGALAGDGEGHLVPLPVRRERPIRLSTRQLAKEAKRVLAQADSVVCSSQTLFDQPQKENKNSVNSNRKFSTLPPLRKKSKNSHRNKGNHSLGEESPSSSVERSIVKSNKRSPKTDEQSLHKESPACSLDRKSIKRSGGKNIVASVLSSLDRTVAKKKKHASADQDTDSFRYSRNNSSSLNDLEENSSSSLDRAKKHRISLKRSVSDAGTRKYSKKNFKNKISGVFLSLDRLTAKQNKNKNKPLVIHSDYSDRSPPRPRKNILKKSYSDSESTSQIAVEETNHHLYGEGQKKKQLSPIIEVLPRDDYFHKANSTHNPEETDTSKRDSTMLHSSQLPTQKPSLTRGHTVDAIVKRLSQDFNQTRGPPRVVNSAPGLITPEHRQHNNNLPFSYTKPTTHQYGSSTPTVEPTRTSPLNGGPAATTRAPTAVDGQVIYAEVVVSGGGGSGGAVSKQTVHTKVLPLTQTQLEEPIQPKIHTRQLEKTHFQQAHDSFPSQALPKESLHKVRVKVTDQASDEDEGLGLTMEHSSYRHKLMGYKDEGKSSNRKGVMDSYSGGNNYTSTERFVQKRIINGEEERSSLQNSSRREIRNDYSGNNVRKEYSVHESRYGSENYTIDPSARGRADGMDSKKKDFIMSENYNSGDRYDDGFYHNHNGKPKDGVRRNLLGDYTENTNYKSEFYSDARIIPLDETDGHRRELLSRGIDSNDLSSRRDRLESRIESQRKDRFVSNKYSDVGYGDHMDTRNEMNRKYATDVTFNSRHDFLNSQLDYDRNPTIREQARHENDKNYGLKSSRYFENTTTTTKTEVDSYGKKDLLADSGIEVDYRTKDSTKNNRKYNELQVHDTKIPINHHKQNVTKVELRNHSYDHTSDDDDDEDDDTGMDENLHHHRTSNHYSDINDHHKTKSTNTLTSTRLVQEQKHNEAIPSSTVLIRHWVPLNKEDSSNTKNKYTQVSKTGPEKSQQSLLSDDEDYEKSRKADEYGKQPAEEYRKIDEKEKENDEKGHRHADTKVTKKKHSSTMDKMRQLFTRSDKSVKRNKKKEEKVKVNVEEGEEIDPLTSRYTEYRGSDTDVHNESSRTLHQERSHLRGSNMQLEQQETPKPAHKNGRLSERGSPKDRRYLDQDTAYQSSHNGRGHYTRTSNMDLDKSIPRPSNQEGNRGQPSGLEENKEPKQEEFHHPIRQRLATPSPSPTPPQANNKSTAATLTRINNMKNKEQNSNGSGGWFKSLDRLTKRGKNRVKEHDKDADIATEDETKTVKQNNNNISSNNKNLRFFGDTDQESVTSTLHQPNHQTLRRYKSNSNSGTNGTRTASHNRLQVPSRNPGGMGLRHYRSAGDVATSSAESTTEGDSSQQSQRSVVYLHAATVGDIPGPPRSQRSGVTRRAQSREELSSTGGSSHPLQPQARTVSRSISVLAPWKPRHYKEGFDVHYDNDDNGTTGRNDNGKPPKVPMSQHSSGNLTMNRSGGVNRHKNNGDRSKENHTTPHKQTVNKSTSTESLGRKNGTSQGQCIRDKTSAEKKYSALNSSTSVESLSQRQNRDRGASSKKHSALNSSVGELNSSKTYRTATKTGNEEGAKRNSGKLSRSASMPKDSGLAAGWFKLRNKKQGM